MAKETEIRIRCSNERLLAAESNTTTNQPESPIFVVERIHPRPYHADLGFMNGVDEPTVTPLRIHPSHGLKFNLKHPQHVSSVEVAEDESGTMFLRLVE